MNPLKLNQSILTLVGVCADQKGIGLLRKIKNLFLYGLILAMTILNSTATSLYFIKYVSTDYEGAIYGLLAATVLICQVFILINLRFHSEQLRTIFTTIYEINHECKTTSNQETLLIVNNI